MNDFEIVPGGDRFCSFIPTAMIDDPPVWQAFWEDQVRQHGGEPTGEPELTTYTNQFDGQVTWLAYGPATRPGQAED
jgi:hypothetical protein